MLPNTGSALPFSDGPSMHEATRLVQAGRLAEATALIQRTLGGSVPLTPPVGIPGTPPGRAPRPRRAPGRPKQRREPCRQLAALRGRLPSMPDLGGLPTTGLPTTGLPTVGLPTIGAEDPAATLPGTVRTGVHQNPAGSRPYRLYVPSTSAGSPRPLLVMLHGGTQDAASFATATKMDALAEEHGFLVVYPEQVTSANPMRYWNWFSPADQSRGSGEPAIIAGLIDELVTTEQADPARVYVAGFSAGAAMAAVLASTHPDVVAAVGIHSGLPAGVAHDMVSAFTAMRSPGPASPLARPVPAITFHGDADSTVSVANSHSLGRQFGIGAISEVESGIAASGKAYTVNRQRERDTVMLEQWIVQGLGHAWSGGRPGASYTDPTGPDASREIVRFFLGHHR